MTPTTGFVPGASTGIVTPGSLVLAGAGADRTRLADLTRSGAGPAELVVAGPPDIAVVAVDGSSVRAIALGATSIELAVAGGAPSVTVARTSDVREVHHVESIVLRCGDVADAAEFHLAAGVVPASLLERTLEPSHSNEAAPDPADDPDDPADPFDTMFGHTVARTVEAAAVREGRIEAARPLGVLLFSTGERVVVDQPIVLGRNPGPLADLDASRLVRVHGPGVSRRHAAIRVDRWRAAIDDLGSANGTEVTLPGRPPQLIAPGHPVGLVAGARVDLGGDVSFVVEDVA